MMQRLYHLRQSAISAAFFFSVLLCLFALGCRREPEAQVVLYVSADEHIARQVIDAFEKETGIAVKMVGDTEAKKTTGLVDRLRSEADNPQADVFWSSEIFLTIQLAEEGVLEEHLSEATRDWPNRWRDGQRRWFGFAARARVIVYSPERVSPDELPTTWMNLTQERYRGRIVMADPRFGTTGGHLGAMMAYWNADLPGYYEAFLEGLAENDVRLLPSGNAGVVKAVASGEADVGMTDTDDVWAAQANGLKVELVYAAHSPDPREPGGGTLLIPNTVARIKAGPHPEQAKRLIDFLLSARVEQMLAESVSHNVPLGAGRAAEEEYAIASPMRIDYEQAAALRSRAIDLAMKRLRPAEAGESP